MWDLARVALPVALVVVLVWKDRSFLVLLGWMLGAFGVAAAIGEGQRGSVAWAGLTMVLAATGMVVAGRRFDRGSGSAPRS